MAPVDTTPEHTITVRATDLTAGGHPLPKNWLVRVVLIWSGYALSAIAGNAVSYSGVWYITETTGSPMALSLMYVLAFLPMGLLAPLGGVLADRHSRKKIIVACDAVMAVSGAVVATVMVLFGPSYAAVIAMTNVAGDFWTRFAIPSESPDNGPRGIEARRARDRECRSRRRGRTARSSRWPWRWTS